MSPTSATPGTPSTTASGSPRPVRSTPATTAPPATYPAGPLAPVVSRIATTRPVVFVTIDDGWTRDPDFPTALSRAGVPVTLFLVADAARKDYPYFQQLQRIGATIEDHTLTHPVCPAIRYADQVRQICQTAATYRTVFGRRPTLFRPPYGDFDASTRRAAAACGMHALVNWDVTVNSGHLAYAAATHLRPGDIILMHFTTNIRRDFAAAIAAAKAAGLTVRSLENYI